MQQQLLYLGAGFDFNPIVHRLIKAKKNSRLSHAVATVKTFVYVDMEPYPEYYAFHRNPLTKKLTNGQIQRFIYKIIRDLLSQNCYLSSVQCKPKDKLIEIAFLEAPILLRYYYGTRLCDIESNPDLLRDMQQSNILYVYGFFFEDQDDADLQEAKMITSHLIKCNKIITDKFIASEHIFKSFLQEIIDNKSKYTTKKIAVLKIL